MMTRGWEVLGLLLVCSTVHAVEVYQATGSDGVVTFSDQPITGGQNEKKIQLNENDISIAPPPLLQQPPTPSVAQKINHQKIIPTPPPAVVTPSSIQQASDDRAPLAEISASPARSKQEAELGVKSAYGNLREQNKQLSEKIENWQRAQANLDHLPAGNETAIAKQQTQIQLMKQAVDAAKVRVSEAEQQLNKQQQQLKNFSGKH